jgi:hypothetical protein
MYDPHAHIRSLLMKPLPFGTPKGAATVHGRLCTAGRRHGRGAVLREFPATPLGTARQDVA